jgi:hypothetical protein
MAVRRLNSAKIMMVNFFIVGLVKDDEKESIGLEDEIFDKTGNYR